MTPDRILVFVPCYNCAAQVGRVLRQFTPAVGAHVAEILVLDNGSRDGTVDAALAAAGAASAPVTVARNHANYNLGGSHKAAFAYAERGGFSHVLILHGDDQGSVADILPVLEAGLHRRHDACLGARFARGASLPGYSRFRIFGNHVFNALFTLAARRRVLDLGSGLNIVAATVFSDPAVTRYADDLRFNIFLLLGLFEAGRSVMFFPITWREDDQVSNVKMASQAWRTLAILRDYVLRRRHFRVTDWRATRHDSYGFDVVHPAIHAAQSA